MKGAILVIDSGVGGLTTLARIRAIMPNLDIIYFADDEFMPYGNKSKELISKRICDIVRRFENQICAVVLACNTATGVAINFVRKLFRFPFVGTEPAVALALGENDAIASIVTPLASKQQNYYRLVCGRPVDTLLQPNLARDIESCLLENGYLHALEHNKSILDSISFIKQDLHCKKIDKLVLGCTHYVFLKYTSLLKEFKLFDGNDGVAKRLAGIVEDSGAGALKIVFSSGNKKKSQIALELLKELTLFNF